VTATPLVRTRALTSRTPFFILASDGLWDRLDYDEAAGLCAEAKKRGLGPEEAASALVKEALSAGSGDNVTCIVVYVSWD
jgi:serine/threonine protein phosphatase PrpC